MKSPKDWLACYLQNLAVQGNSAGHIKAVKAYAGSVKSTLSGLRAEGYDPADILDLARAYIISMEPFAWRMTETRRLCAKRQRDRAASALRAWIARYIEPLAAAGLALQLDNAKAWPLGRVVFGEEVARLRRLADVFGSPAWDDPWNEYGQTVQREGKPADIMRNAFEEALAKCLRSVGRRRHWPALEALSIGLFGGSDAAGVNASTRHYRRKARP